MSIRGTKYKLQHISAKRDSSCQFTSVELNGDEYIYHYLRQGAYVFRGVIVSQFVWLSLAGLHQKLLNHHQWSSAVEQVFDILSLCLRPSLSSAARLSATKPPPFAKSCSI